MTDLEVGTMSQTTELMTRPSVRSLSNRLRSRKPSAITWAFRLRTAFVYKVIRHAVGLQTGLKLVV